MTARLKVVTLFLNMAKNGTADEFVVFFIPSSARQILGMELSNNFITQDELYWPHIETGEYSTKSAYASQQHQNDICSVTTLLYLCVFFRIIWRLNIMPK